MSIEAYAAIALVSLEVDALFCMAHGRPFRPVWAMLFAAVWPITACFVVICAMGGARIKP